MLHLHASHVSELQQPGSPTALTPLKASLVAKCMDFTINYNQHCCVNVLLPEHICNFSLLWSAMNVGKIIQSTRLWSICGNLTGKKKKKKSQVREVSNTMY